MNTEFQKRLQTFEDRMHRLGRSPRTISTYKSCITHLHNHYPGNPDRISNTMIQDYLTLMATTVGYSRYTQAINAIKAYYETVDSRPRLIADIERPKRPHNVPTVLSVDEVRRLLAATKNVKHHAIITTLYGLGIRLDELLSLKLSDYDKARHMVTIHGKGNRERDLYVHEKLRSVMNRYYTLYRPPVFWFTGQKGGKYSSTSVQNIVKRSARRAIITKPTTPHTLRHSFATHMLEQGVDLRYIQRLLGHARSSTTEIYTHVSNHKISTLYNPLQAVA